MYIGVSGSSRKKKRFSQPNVIFIIINAYAAQSIRTHGENPITEWHGVYKCYVQYDAVIRRPNNILSLLLLLWFDRGGRV